MININLPLNDRMSAEQFTDVYESGKVTRWHTSRAFGQQTNADHSWGVAMIITMLWPDASAALLKAALMHDLPERMTGDVPSHAKWNFLPLKEAVKTMEENYWKRVSLKLPVLSEEEKKQLALADQIEALMFLSVTASETEVKNATEILASNINTMQQVGTRN